MRPNPLLDAITFLTKGDYLAARYGIFVSLYWLLLAGALLGALLAWRQDAGQRGTRAGGILLLRVLTGTMWWEQSLWKIPPHYGGLVYWMKQEVAHAAVPLQSVLVRDVVLPNIGVFGPLVYAIEAGIGASLILGLYTRLGALFGIAMAVNLWLGLYSAPGEWPWTYFFLITIMALFCVDPPGRVLGWDAARHRAGANRFSYLA
ncbi:MAG: DoxX family membrane protein [Rhodospirillales bacterium]|nr:DoxX family membrane protein [Rhodospirillales bacterium]